MEDILVILIHEFNFFKFTIIVGLLTGNLWIVLKIWNIGIFLNIKFLLFSFMVSVPKFIF